MRPVQQTHMIPGGGGNCVAACIASIFELPLPQVFPEVPNGGSAQAIFDWTAKHHPGLAYVDRTLGRYEQRGELYHEVDGYEVIEHAPQERLPPWSVDFWIGYFVSPRGVLSHKEYGIWHPSLHAVVCRRREVLWDPHPRRDMGVGALRKTGYWIVKDPALL